VSEKLEIQQFSLWDRLKSKHSPISFDIELTARCNMDCRHCYINLPAGDDDAISREMSIGEIADIADQAIDMGTVWCLLTGGEPLLRQDFTEIYMMLKKKGLLVSVFTNATLLREEHIALFKKYPPRDIETTVYGVTKETYERVTRRPGSFEKFMNGLDMLIENGVRIRLKTMAIRSNLHEQNEIAEFCRARTKDFFRFDPQLHLRFDGNEKRNAEIRSERLTPEKIIELEKSDEERFGALIKNCSKLINDDFGHINCDHLFHCGAGSGSFNVSYDGRFRLCSSLWAEETTCDLRKNTLKSAWNNLVPRVRDMRSQKKEFLETCRKCALVNLCLWCPAHAHLETAKMDGSTPYFCEVAHARAAAIKEKTGFLQEDQTR
jgi:radical SAM protein with 4Fe4S-binding SPASM domain